MSAEKASCAIIYKTVSSRSESNQSAYRLIPAQQLQIFEHANLEQFGLAECFCLLAILIGDQLCLGRRASVGDKDGAGGLTLSGMSDEVRDGYLAGIGVGRMQEFEQVGQRRHGRSRWWRSECLLELLGAVITAAICQ